MLEKQKKWWNRFLLVSAFGPCLQGFPEARANPAQRLDKILVINGPRGSHSAAIDSGEAMLKSLSREMGFQADFITDGSGLTVPMLNRYQAVLFNNTSQVGNILQDAGKAAFLQWYRSGGALVAWHAAADLGGTWNWFQEIIGSRFYGHSGIVSAQLQVDPESRGHVAVKGLAAVFPFKDEWYSFRINPRGTPGTTILLTVDESTYEAPNAMGADHPMSWCRRVEGGRVFFTGLGHEKTAFSTRIFQDHLYNGILWAAGLDSAGASALVRPALGPRRKILASSREIRISVSGKTRHRISVINLQGRILASGQGTGSAEYSFPGLPRRQTLWVRIEEPDATTLEKVLVL